MWMGVGARVLRGALASVLGVGLAASACGDDTGSGSGEGTASSSEGASSSTAGTTLGPGATSVVTVGADTTAGPGPTTGGTTVAADGTSTGGTTRGDTTSGATTMVGTTGEATTGTSSTTGGGPGCGNGAIDAGEQCDGLDLQGFDCASLGLGGGVLACDPVTCTFDSSMCAPIGNCGNGVIDPGEQCDGLDLQGFDCTSLGLGGGVLACDPVMCTFDTSMCIPVGGTSG